MAKKKKSKCSNSCKKCIDDNVNTNNSTNCSDNENCMNKSNLNKSDR